LQDALKKPWPEAPMTIGIAEETASAEPVAAATA